MPREPQEISELVAARLRAFRDDGPGSSFGTGSGGSFGAWDHAPSRADLDQELVGHQYERASLFADPSSAAWSRCRDLTRRSATIHLAQAQVDDGLGVLLEPFDVLMRVTLPADVMIRRATESAVDLILGLTAVLPGPTIIARLEELVLTGRSRGVGPDHEVLLVSALSAAHRSLDDLATAESTRDRLAVLCRAIAGEPVVVAWVVANLDVRMGRFDSAADGFHRALAHEEPMPIELRFDLLSGLGEALARSGRMEEAEDSLWAALATGARGGLRRLAATTELLAEIARSAGRWEEAYELLGATRRHEAEFMAASAWAAELRLLTILEAGLIATDPAGAATGSDGPTATGPDGPAAMAPGPTVTPPEPEVVDLRDSSRAASEELTGLPGRASIRAELASFLGRGVGCSVLAVDLDHLGRVNESLGHRVGDGLITEIADRLRSLARPQDMVGHWGGDEFVVILPHIVEHAAAQSAAERVAERLGQLWIAPGGDRVVPSLSLGVTTSTPGGPDADVLLGRADIARLRAKRLGGARIEWFGDVLSEAARHRYDTEQLVRDGLSDARFEMWFQPVHSNHSSYPIAAEALLRLRMPDGSVLAPGAFLEVAEDTGLSRPLGRWVIDETCRIGGRWARQGVPFRLAVNVSATQVDSSFPSLLADALRRNELDPSMLVVELTEHAILAADEEQVGALDEVRATGVRLALDDFGTAYSSLNHLRQFEVDVVKIDRSFVAGLGEDPRDAAIVQAVVDLSRTFGFRVIAEGVETTEQLDLQRQLGCHGAQGYLLGRPRPAEAFERLLGSQPLVDLLLDRHRDRLLV